jgi:hypothetical protein
MGGLGLICWVKAHSPDGQRDGLLARIAFVWSQADPMAAARLVAEEVSVGNRQIEASMAVLHQWGLRNHQEAMAWAASFPEGAVRERALDELTGVARYRSTR